MLIMGCQNLIFYRREHLWQSVLSVYFCESNVTCPNTSQVLICSENTTREDVEIFYRRAVCNTNNLYSLIVEDNIHKECVNAIQSYFGKIKNFTETGREKINSLYIIFH